MKIYTYRLDDFLNNKESKLLIAGIVGSGKTYNGERIAKILNCKFEDFDAFFYANMDLKKSNPQEYISKRKNFEYDLFFSNAKAVVAGLGPILRNENKHEILNFPIILLDTNPILATYRATLRNIKNIFKSKLYSHWKNELLFPYKGNLQHVDNFKRLKSQYKTESLQTFPSLNSLLNYIKSIPVKY